MIFAPASAVAANAVLGGEQRDQPQPAVARDQVDVRHAGAIDRAVVGDEPDALAAEIGRQVLEEHLDARPNRARTIGRRDRADDARAGLRQGRSGVTRQGERRGDNHHGDR